MYRLILVPIDESDLSVSTSSKAVRFAKSLGAELVFLHARADLGATDEGALVRVMSPAAFAENPKDATRGILAKAEIVARDSGVPCRSVAKTSDRPYEAILDTAEELGCDLIFMASHGQRGLKGLLLGSQTQKVLAHTSIPVLVSTVESNAVTPEMNAAMSAIRGEHRSLGSVMHGFKRALEKAREDGGRLDLRLAKSIVLYFRRFTQDLHHPKEEQYLFGRLCSYMPEAAQVVSVLEQQHKEEPALIEAIEVALSAYEKVPDLTHMEVVAKAVEQYADRLWEHMSLEEGSILPGCRDHFSRSDWKLIADAFLENADPRFDQKKEAGYDDLFFRIMNMAEKFEKS